MAGKVPSSALAARNSVWGAVARGIGLQHRCLSSSPRRQARGLITFPETSSSELDEILSTLRQKIILPSYIRMEQRKKLYDHKWAKKLEMDPVTMEIDGHRLNFYYTNLLTEMPNTRELIFKAVDRMKTSQDWETLPRLLEGVCQRAGRKLRYYDYPKLVRKAALSGHLNVILTCVREVKRTGFKLSSSEIVNELLVWIQKEAIDSGWSQEATESALAWTERTIDALEDGEHLPKRRHGEQDPKAFPLYLDPQVLGSRLHMAAAVAVKHNGGEDVDDKVADYVKEIIALWPEGKGLMDLHAPEVYEERKELRYLQNKNEFLWHAAPILSGFKMATEVVEPDLAEALRRRIEPLEKEVEAALADNTRKSGGRGEDVYGKLFGKQEA